MNQVSSPPSFREAFCRRFGCPVDSYADTVLSHCLYSHARVPAILLKRVAPRAFETDYKLIEEVGRCTTAEQAKKRVNHYLLYNSLETFMARRLRIRLSGRRLLSLAADLLPRDEAAQPAGK